MNDRQPHMSSKEHGFGPAAADDSLPSGIRQEAELCGLPKANAADDTALLEELVAMALRTGVGAR
jgi:hypothetical protein